jgi:hypothetical protein
MEPTATPTIALEVSGAKSESSEKKASVRRGSVSSIPAESRQRRPSMMLDPAVRQRRPSTMLEPAVRQRRPSAMGLELQAAEATMKQMEADKEVALEQAEADKQVLRDQFRVEKKLLEDQFKTERESHAREISGLRETLTEELTKPITMKLRAEVEAEALERKARGARMEEMELNERERVSLSSPSISLLEFF